MRSGTQIGKEAGAWSRRLPHRLGGTTWAGSTRSSQGREAARMGPAIGPKRKERLYRASPALASAGQIEERGSKKKKGGSAGPPLLVAHFEPKMPGSPSFFGCPKRTI